MKNYVEVYTKLSQELKEVLDEIYFENAPETEKAKRLAEFFYVYVDQEKTNAEHVAFGVVTRGVEKFGNEEFRTGLKWHLKKKFGEGVDVPRMFWGRVIDDLGTKESNLYLFHIVVPMSLLFKEEQ